MHISKAYRLFAEFFNQLDMKSEKEMKKNYKNLVSVDLLSSYLSG